MDVRTRDMPDLIAYENDVVWLRTRLLPAEVIVKLGIIMAAIAAAADSLGG